MATHTEFKLRNILRRDAGNQTVVDAHLYSGEFRTRKSAFDGGDETYFDRAAPRIVTLEFSGILDDEALQAAVRRWFRGRADAGKEPLPPIPAQTLKAADAMARRPEKETPR